MKKNNKMFKIIAIMILVVALLSWIIPASQYNGTTLMSKEITRVSLFDLFLYPTTVIPQQASFIRPLLFILAVGGLYGVLSKTGKYRNALEKIAKSMKGKEELFLIGTSVLLAIITSVFGFNPILLLIIVPALCSIIILMGYDKITALLITFLSPLIGIIGNTYGGTYANYINQILSTTYSTELIFKIALFVLSYILYIFFTISYARKYKRKNPKKENTDKDETNDEIPFLGEKIQSKKPSWPIFVILGILMVLTILGHTNWVESFNTTFFTDLHKAVTEWKIFNHTVLAYLINDLGAFGDWFFAETTVLLVVASGIISLVYNLKGEGLKAFYEGVLKVLKPTVIILLSYTVLVISAFHPYFITVTVWLMDLIKNVTGPLGELLFILFASINTIISTILNIDFVYVLQGTTQYITTDATNVLGLISQSMHGITLFLAPTSTLLLLGLEYLGISYKEWLKTSWKLVLQLLAIALVIIIVVTFI